MVLTAQGGKMSKITCPRSDNLKTVMSSPGLCYKMLIHLINLPVHGFDVTEKSQYQVVRVTMGVPWLARWGDRQPFREYKKDG